MKNLLLGGLLLAAAPLAFCASTDTGSSSVNVTVESESKELAGGFAAAFSRLRRVPFHVQLQRDGRNFVINDVKAVTASGAALLIETNKGLFYVINPKDVVWFSDSPVPADKPAAVTTAK